MKLIFHKISRYLNKTGRDHYGNYEWIHIIKGGAFPARNGGSYSHLVAELLSERKNKDLIIGD